MLLLKSQYDDLCKNDSTRSQYCKAEFSYKAKNVGFT